MRIIGCGLPRVNWSSPNPRQMCPRPAGRFSIAISGVGDIGIDGVMHTQNIMASSASVPPVKSARSSVWSVFSLATEVSTIQLIISSGSENPVKSSYASPRRTLTAFLSGVFKADAGDGSRASMAALSPPMKSITTGLGLVLAIR